MPRLRRSLSDQASVDLTPMLDVVFILLIFFIVTSTFLEEEAIGMEIEKAVEKAEEAIEKAEEAIEEAFKKTENDISQE